jgi:hypothetical protein
MTQASTEQLNDAEVGAEVWYLIDPTPGTANISVPNTGTKSMRLYTIGFGVYNPTLYTSALDTGTGAPGTSTVDAQNPSVTITPTTTGAAVFSVCAHGANTPTLTITAPGIRLFSHNETTVSTAAQFILKRNASAQSMTFGGASSDDVAMLVVGFIPQGRTQTIGISAPTASTTAGTPSRTVGAVTRSISAPTASTTAGTPSRTVGTVTAITVAPAATITVGIPQTASRINVVTIAPMMTVSIESAARIIGTISVSTNAPLMATMVGIPNRALTVTISAVSALLATSLGVTVQFNTVIVHSIAATAVTTVSTANRRMYITAAVPLQSALQTQTPLSVTLTALAPVNTALIGAVPVKGVRLVPSAPVLTVTTGTATT